MPSLAYAQVDSNDIYIKRYEGIRHSASHGNMVWFTNQGYDVASLFDIYLQMKKDYYIVDDEKIPFYTSVFRKRYAGNPDDKPKPLRVQYIMAKDKTVSKVVISGSWAQCADIFISYWEKPFNLQEKRKATGEVAWLNSFGDRVSFINVGAYDAKIVITPNATTQKNYYYFIGTDEHGKRAPLKG